MRRDINKINLPLRNVFNKMRTYSLIYTSFYFHLRILMAKEVYKRLLEKGYKFSQLEK